MIGGKILALCRNYFFFYYYYSSTFNSRYIGSYVEIIRRCSEETQWEDGTAKRIYKRAERIVKKELKVKPW